MLIGAQHPDVQQTCNLDVGISVLQQVLDVFGAESHQHQLVEAAHELGGYLRAAFLERLDRLTLSVDLVDDLRNRAESVQVPKVVEALHVFLQLFVEVRKRHFAVKRKMLAAGFGVFMFGSGHGLL